jgi:hypothetical protein
MANLLSLVHIVISPDGDKLPREEAFKPAVREISLSIHVRIGYLLTVRFSSTLHLDS